MIIQKKSLFCLLLCTASSLIYTQKQLRILVAVGTFPVLSEVFILNQITGLIDRGHDVSIFSMGRGDCSAMHEEVRQYNLLSLAKYKQLNTSDLKTYDLVLCQFGHIGVEFARIKKQYNLSFLIATCFRGYDTSVRLRMNPHFYDDLFKVGDLFLPVCDFFKKRLVSLGAPPEKVNVQYSTIDCKKFYFKERIIPDNGIVNIMTAARLVPKKGHVYMLQAFAQLIKQFPRVHYTIVGSGKLKSKLVKLVDELHIKSHVTFIDAVPHDKLIKMLDAVDLFVLPSVVDHRGDSEGISNALKEAMVMGIPVISTIHSGTPELVEHMHTGLLVSEKNVEQLYGALRYALEHPLEMSCIAYNGHKKVICDFELESQNDKLNHYLQQLCN